MNYHELAKEFQVSESTIKTNFPKFCSAQLKKGFQITKKGKGETAEYFVLQVSPKNIDKKDLSTIKREIIEDLPGEIWVDSFIEPQEFEVSSFGRLRNKKTKIQTKGTIVNGGYCRVTIKRKPIMLNRLVLQSFYPIENFTEMTVDHINGIKDDNSLKNLRWTSNEENVMYMMQHRADLNKELTRIIQIFGYDKTLTILKNINAEFGPLTD